MASKSSDRVKDEDEEIQFAAPTGGATDSRKYFVMFLGIVP